MELASDIFDYVGLFGLTAWLIALAAIVAGIAYPVIYLIHGPLLSDRQRRYDEFWRTMPASKAHGYQGALLWDEWLDTMSRPKFSIRRLILVLKHEDNARSEILFRSKENPNVDSLDDTIRAFSLWIKTARDHDIPAVYRAGWHLHALTDAQ